MKSFKNINILIKVILSCLKNFFFLKSFYLKEKYVFENKNKKIVWRILFGEKNIKKKIFITSGAWKSWCIIDGPKGQESLSLTSFWNGASTLLNAKRKGCSASRQFLYLSIVNARAETTISHKYELGKAIKIFKASSYNIGYSFATWHKNLGNESLCIRKFFLKS